MPVTADPNLKPQNRLSQRTRWWLHLAILSIPILVSVAAVAAGQHPKLPQTLPKLAWFIDKEFALWGGTFWAAFKLSGITASRLRVDNRNPLRLIGFGFLWFIAIRIVSALILWIAFKWIDHQWLWSSEEKLASAVNAQTIAQHPLFCLFAFGLCSLIAGSTEELWRSGMLAGLEELFPFLKKKTSGALICILIISIPFASAHLYLGWVGIANALLLGLFFGLILVYRHSYWEAAIAHALTDILAFSLIIFMASHASSRDTMVLYSASHGDLPQLKHWVALGGNVNTVSKSGDNWTGLTALEYAAGEPAPDIVQFLLEKGADPDLSDNLGKTPLIAAVEQNRVENIKLLLAHGANLNWQTKKGLTALWIATEYDRIDAARLLLDSGANPHLTDLDGLTPLAVATKLGYADMIKMLKEKEAR